MPKLYSSRHIIKILERKGFVFVKGRSSHFKFRLGNLTVIVPANRREVPVGTFRSILRQANLLASDFVSN